MLEQVEHHWRFLLSYIATRWDQLQPYDYIAVLVTVSVVGLVLMRSKLK